ncbi:MAG: glycosyltransferase family 4 protein [Proteobacteria bacterium]|nr:glycosyltransferase family 4 protein [Pseudomonadota bacterium]
MKIALVTWSYNTYEGVSRCVVELANRLVSSHEVHIFASAFEQSPPEGVNVHKIDLRFRRQYPAECEFILRVRTEVKRECFDVVHLHAPVLLPAQVLTSHGVFLSAFRSMRRFPSRPRRDVLYRRILIDYIQLLLFSYHILHRKTLITAVTERVRQEVVSFSRRQPEEVPVIPNGVDLDLFHPQLVKQWRKRTRADLGFRDDQFLLLFIGNDFRYKGVRYAIETIARLPEKAVLVVVGAGDPKSIPGSQDLLEGLMLSRRVVFVGQDREVWRYYGAVDALLFPSLYESFGLVVLEAMASGLPVVTARTVAFGDEVIRDGHNGFVVGCPWDVNEMAERIRTLMENPELGKSIGKRCRETAELYSWDRYAELTEAVYEQVVNGSDSYVPEPSS